MSVPILGIDYVMLGETKPSAEKSPVKSPSNNQPRLSNTSDEAPAPMGADDLAAVLQFAAATDETESERGDTWAEAPITNGQQNSIVYESVPALEIDQEAVVGGDARMQKTKAIKKQKVEVQNEKQTPLMNNPGVGTAPNTVFPNPFMNYV